MYKIDFMHIDRDKTIEWLSKYFRNYYDIVELERNSEIEPVYRCDLHVTNQKYFLTKKSVLWEANCHEYLYVFSVDHLDLDGYKAIEKYVNEKGSNLIEPNQTHMYTYLTAFIVCDSADIDAQKAIKRCRVRKDFKLSLHGWMELHTALCICESGRFATNRTGREYKKLLRNISNSNKLMKGR